SSAGAFSFVSFSLLQHGVVSILVSSLLSLQHESFFICLSFSFPAACSSQQVWLASRRCFAFALQHLPSFGIAAPPLWISPLVLSPWSPSLSSPPTSSPPPPLSTPPPL